MGPSTYARVAEIMSGRTISQQGLAATCKDLAHKGYPEAREGIWSDAWAHRSKDGEATLSQMTLEVIPTGSNGSGGQRSPGHSAAVVQGRREEMAVWPNLAHRNVSGGLVLVIHGEGLDKPVSQGAYTRQRLSSGVAGQVHALINGMQSRGQNRTWEIRPSGIAGRL